MNPVAIMMVVHATLTAASTDSYTQAFHLLNETGRPMVVLVGADWCPACVTMKESVIPQARREGLLSGVNFAQINMDRQPELAQQILEAGSKIPQLVLYQKNPDGTWKRDQLIGLQSVGSISALISRVGAGVPQPEVSSVRSVIETIIE